jgi:hypothetical protein
MREPMPTDVGVSRPATFSSPRPVPIIRSSGPSYYLFQQGGQRMAITVLHKGTKIRINDAVDVVVLDVCGEAVRIGVLDDSQRPSSSDAAD